MSGLRSALGRLVRRHGVAAPSTTSATDAPAPPLVGFVVHGAGGVHPASAHVRVTGRLSALAASGAARVAQVEPTRWADGTDTAHLDVLLVQRDAFPEAALDAALARASAAGTRVVAEVDDDFFSREARDRLARAEYDPQRLASVDRLVRAADAVVVSTDRLRRVLADVGVPGAVVVPNAVQPGLWDAGVPAAADTAGTGPSAPDGVAAPRRALYMGSATHADDLDLLRPAFDGLTDDAGRPVRLEVVGVTGSDDATWYDRLPLPDTATHYPDFVAFLREHASRWSVGVAPLTDDPFNDAKSDLKFLEYTMLGLPFVGSDRPAYRGADEHGGLLVGDDPAAWRTALGRALGEADDRVRAARAYVLAERVLTADGPWRAALGLGPR